MALDVQGIRADFPALRRTHLDRPIVYLDSACVTLTPVQVIDAMSRWYAETPGCAGRTNHLFGRECTRAQAEARAALQRFVNAGRAGEIVFTRNATEALNLVAACLPLKAGDVVVCSGLEHNSNLLPWLRLQQRGDATLRVVPNAPDTTFDLDAFRAALAGPVKVVAVPHVSNLSGVSSPLGQIARLAHAAGAVVVVDGTQAVSHLPVDVRALDVDFYAFSAHKMLGPTGMGCLYGKAGLLESLPHFLVGGETVVDATYDEFRTTGIPDRLEAGIQNYAGAVGFARAAEYLGALSLPDVAAHLLDLNSRLTAALAGHPRIRLIGPADPALRGGIFTFSIDGLDSFDMAKMLDASDNLMLRAGRHCTHAWFHHSGAPDSIRASMYVYNTRDEVDLLARKVQDILKYF